MQFTVSAMRRFSTPRVTQAGTAMLANFDAGNSDIVFRGCVLARLANGRFIAWAPRLESATRKERRRNETAVHLPTGSSIAADIATAAMQVYHALGGVELPDCPETGEEAKAGVDVAETPETPPAANVAAVMG